jgi:hypothetical protein
MSQGNRRKIKGFLQSIFSYQQMSLHLFLQISIIIGQSLDENDEEEPWIAQKMFVYLFPSFIYL